MAWQQNSFQQEVSTQRIHIIHMIICISSANLTCVLVLQTLLHVSSMVSRHSCDFLRICLIQEQDTPRPFRSASSVCLSICLSVCLYTSACLSSDVCLCSGCLLICSPVCPYICLFVCLSVHMPVCASVCVPVFVYACPSVRQPFLLVCLSVL